MTSKAARFITQLMAEIAKRDARIAELERFKCAYNEWHEKTEWVQSEVSTGIIGASALGLHRADVMARLVAELRLELAALKAQQPSAGVVLPEPDFYWISGDEGSWNSPEEWAQDYYDNNGEKPESVLLSCAAELPDREYDSFEFDENGNCTSLRLVVRDEVARLNPCRAQAVPDVLDVWGDDCGCGIEQHSAVRYVLASDYDRLEQERAEQWISRRDALACLDTEKAVVAELRAQVEVMRADSDLYRQWFNAVQDCSPRYLERKDYEAAIRLLERLGVRVPLSVVAGAALQAKP